MYLSEIHKWDRVQFQTPAGTYTGIVVNWTAHHARVLINYKSKSQYVNIDLAHLKKL